MIGLVYGGTSREMVLFNWGSLFVALSLSSMEMDGKVRPTEVVGGERYVDKSLGNGGTGGTSPSSFPSPWAAIDATRSLMEASVE